MNECFRCKKKVSEKKTAWHNRKTYCRDCCEILVYFDRLKRNDKKKIKRKKR